MLEPRDREAFAKALEAGVPRSRDANGGSPVQANELDFEKPRSA